MSRRPGAAAAPDPSSPVAVPSGDSPLSRVRAAQHAASPAVRRRRVLTALLGPAAVLALALLATGAYLGVIVAVLATAVSVGAVTVLTALPDPVPEPAPDPAPDLAPGPVAGPTPVAWPDDAAAAFALQAELGRRQQALLARQLGRIDELETRETDPAALGELFTLDHLATRMRRCAAGALLLAGADPEPAPASVVAASEVLRGAVAAVEAFDRVDVTVEADVTVLGAAAVDLVHLLAELVENAAAAAPADTRVRVHGQPFGDGYVVTVADEGPGVDPERAAALAAVLDGESSAGAPGQVGYQVVARLARRHGVAVLIRAAAGGGADIAVSVPAALVVGDARPPHASVLEVADDDGSPAPGWVDAPAPAVPDAVPAEWLEPDLSAPVPAVEPYQPVPSGPVLGTFLPADPHPRTTPAAPGDGPAARVVTDWLADLAQPAAAVPATLEPPEWQPAADLAAAPPEPTWAAPAPPEPTWAAPAPPEPTWAAPAPPEPAEPLLPAAWGLESHEPVTTSAPALAWQPPAADETAAPAARVSVPEQPGADRSDPALTAAGLRRRTPQASLAPQMRAPQGTLPGDVAAGPAPDRSRHLLSAYRDGLVLGRGGLAEGDIRTHLEDRDPQGEA